MAAVLCCYREPQSRLPTAWARWEPRYGALQVKITPLKKARGELKRHGSAPRTRRVGKSPQLPQERGALLVLQRSEPLRSPRSIPSHVVPQALLLPPRQHPKALTPFRPHPGGDAVPISRSPATSGRGGDPSPSPRSRGPTPPLPARKFIKAASPSSAWVSRGPSQP